MDEGRYVGNPGTGALWRKGGERRPGRKLLGAGSASHAMGRLVRPLVIEAGMAAPDVP
jgi:hypothetical protein